MVIKITLISMMATSYILHLTSIDYEVSLLDVYIVRSDYILHVVSVIGLYNLMS